MSKPSLVRGTRDFNAATLYKRRYILNTIQEHFEAYGFEPLETPSMENLNTLMGKYGEEGDQLIFKVLNNGLDNPNKFESAKEGLEEVMQGRSSTLLTERALRYDLTIPFARFVVMNHHDLPMPYKRYQMQSVWRADRPQKGRYREFMQCDVDVIGSDSLIHEAELMSIYTRVFKALAIPEIHIYVNNRKILTGLAEVIEAPEQMMDMTVAIDKLDKIAWEGVEKELSAKGFSAEQIGKIQTFLNIKDKDNATLLEEMAAFLTGSETGLKGIEELKESLKYFELLASEEEQKMLKVSFSLARGLSYYTGFIVEVVTKAVKMGSIAGGGRYDDLTGLFGLKNMSGVGVSFGIDRIYDVMEELELFPNYVQKGVKVLFLNLEENALSLSMKTMQELRSMGLSSEIYPKAVRMGNQMKYADRKQVAYVVIIGSQELEEGKAQIRNMQSGDQEMVGFDEIVNYFQNKSKSF